jgi:hypothetical protein
MLERTRQCGGPPNCRTLAPVELHAAGFAATVEPGDRIIGKKEAVLVMSRGEPGGCSA